MAKGYPDFYGFSIWPKYGAVMTDNVIGGVAVDGADTLVHLLVGKGRITGGVFRLRWCADWRFVWPIITVDGNILTPEIGVPGFITWYGADCSGYPVNLKSYTGPLGSCSWDYVKDYVFNDSFQVIIHNNSGIAGDIHSYLNYALMQ